MKLNNRYQILKTIGKGGTAITYKCRDSKSDCLVAIKIVSLRSAKEWKAIELFKREAATLQSLNHPNIPKYFDYFELDVKDNRFFCLVQELISGLSLSELVENSSNLTEQKICQIAKEILLILQYLQSFTPPIIHRDIKPENILIDNQKKLTLVDFGSVQLVHRNPDSFVNTFVGTLGYMPPEQFSGQVFSSSDLYSLGCTLLFLLTKKSPADLPIYRLKIDFRSQINLSPEFASWLDKMIEPIIEDRFQSAQQALQALSALSCEHKLPLSISAKSFSKVKLDIEPTIKNNVFLIEKGNTLFFNCQDFKPFSLQSLQVEGAKFTLCLTISQANSKIQHLIRGQTSSLAVYVLKKEYGIENQNICCSLYDGNHTHNFAQQLDSQQQEQIVRDLSNFISRQKQTS